MSRFPAPPSPVACVAIIVGLCLLATTSVLAQEATQLGTQPGALPTPSEHLGRPLGVDFDLAGWQEVFSYYQVLGERSPNVIVRSAGTTSEGRDFPIVIISSEQNLANLEQIQRHARTLADPRGKSEQEKQAAIENGRPIIFVSCQMHSTETAGSQFSMELAHMLATSDEEPWKSAREQLVTVVFTTNPDGVDHVTQWYREHAGTPFEGAALLELYQLYTGHDNNRDWFMLTQKETQIVTELLYKEWFPTIYWDVHQQGQTGERMFVPPYRDPLSPNLDPNIITGIGAIGSRAMMDMTRAGLTGISTGVSYDMWWNGGNRNVPVRHNIIGILTEAASVDLGSPVFLPRSRLRAPGDLAAYEPSNQFPAPWPGGWWRLRDIIDYEMAFARSLLGSVVREPDLWLRNALEASERTITAADESVPRAWLIPSDNRDPAAVRRLVDVLLKTGVELFISEAELQADGRTYPAGTIVIPRNQPYGTHVKDLFDVQRYPEGAPPYDVAGWTLPFLLGVRRVEVMEPLPADLALESIENAEDAVAGFEGDGRADQSRLSSRDSDTWREVIDALEQGNHAWFQTGGDRAGILEIASADTSPTTQHGDGVAITRMPRIGLYTPWSGNMDEGWMRWLLDTWDIPYVRVRNEMLRAGQLEDFLDVLIIPDIPGGSLDAGRAPGTIPEEYARGLAPEGAVAVEQFVKGGGTLITMESSADWAIELFELPLVDVTGLSENREFNCPGSVLRAVPEEGSAYTADLPSSLALFFSRSAAYREMTQKERDEKNYQPRQMQTLLRYAPERVLLSGWIREPQVIENQSAWIRCQVGEGSVHVFGFRPHYRGWSQATFPLLFRAMLLDSAKE